jgi:hypothetical protein
MAMLITGPSKWDLDASLIRAPGGLGIDRLSA